MGHFFLDMHYKPAKLSTARQKISDYFFFDPHNVIRIQFITFCANLVFLVVVGFPFNVGLPFAKDPDILCRTSSTLLT